MQTETVFTSRIDWLRLCTASRRTGEVLRSTLAEPDFVYIKKEEVPLVTTTLVPSHHQLEDRRTGQIWLGFSADCGLANISWHDGRGDKPCLSATKQPEAEHWLLTYTGSPCGRESTLLLEIFGQVSARELPSKKSDEEEKAMCLDFDIVSVGNAAALLEELREREMRKRAQRLIKAAQVCQILQDKIRLHRVRQSQLGGK